MYLNREVSIRYTSSKLVQTGLLTFFALRFLFPRCQQFYIFIINQNNTQAKTASGVIQNNFHLSVKNNMTDSVISNSSGNPSYVIRMMNHAQFKFVVKKANR